MNDTTDERIATRIVEQLIANKLLTERQAHALRDKIAGGDMKSADWLALADFLHTPTST